MSIFSGIGDVAGSILSGGYALIIAGVVAIALVAGSYFWGYHTASAADKSSEYQAIAEQNATELATVKKQYADAQVSIQTLTDQKNKVQTITGQIYQAMTTQFDFEKFATQNFEKKYHDWAQNYEVQMHRLIGPYSFGSLNVGIFAGDDAIGNYIYFRCC